MPRSGSGGGKPLPTFGALYFPGLSNAGDDCYYPHDNKINSHQVIQDFGKYHDYNAENQAGYSHNQTCAAMYDRHELLPPFSLTLSPFSRKRLGEDMFYYTGCSSTKATAPSTPESSPSKAGLISTALAEVLKALSLAIFIAG